MAVVKRKERPKNALPWWAQGRVGCKRNTPNPTISPSSPLKKKEEELLVPSPMAVRWNELPKNTLPCWRRRVGCKRSTPNTMISPPLKKKKELLSCEDQKENNISDEKPKKESTAGGINAEEVDSILKEDQKENIIPDQKPKKEATAGGINAEAVDFILKELRINQEDMIPDLKDERTTAEAGNSYFTDSRLRINQEDMIPDLKDERTTAEAGNSYFTDSKEQKVIAEDEPNKGAIPVSVNENCSIGGCDSYVPDSRTEGKTIVGSNYDEELASDAESRADTVPRADRWACRVCKEAVVSIAALPCSHLCLCWECEFEVDHCPVCGEPKTGCFYIRSP